jgi:hypothetical protein
MSILFSILIITLLILYLQYRIWRVEHNIVFPIFTGIFYYWSLAGSWLFTFDNLSGLGKSVGFQYYDLLEKMFLVEYDETYLQAIWMYGAFILLFQLLVWLGLKRIVRSQLPEIKGERLKINSNVLAFMALFFLAISLYLVKDVIIYSLILNESVYLNMRTASINGYVIHQYACWFMVVSLFIYLGLSLRKDSRWIELQKLSIFFWIVFIICNAYLIIIGSRHEVFFGGIVVLILMSYPNRRVWQSKKLYFFVISIWLFILMLNDPFRSLTPVVARQVGISGLFNSSENQASAALYKQDRTFVAHKSPQLTERIVIANALKDTVIYLKKDSIVLNRDLFLKQVNEHADYLIVENKKVDIVDSHTSLRYQNISFLTKLSLTMSNLVFSNEIFAGHFSMYGVLKRNVKPRYGISFKNLVYSFIPSVFAKQRPEDAYTYYSHQMKFRGTQGFTINHITAWYLNFSYLGLFIGPLFLSVLLLMPFYFSRKLSSNQGALFSVLALCGITGFAGIMVRSGPESLKPLLYESVIIPIAIVAVGVIITGFLNKRKLRLWKVRK